MIDKEYAPLEDRGAFFVIADGPEGASFEKSYEMLERMEDVLMPLYEKGEATRVLLRLPASFSSTNEVNSVRGIVVLSDWSQRERSMQQIMAAVNRQLAALPGYRAFSVARRGLGGGSGARRHGPADRDQQQRRDRMGEPPDPQHPGTDGQRRRRARLPRDRRRRQLGGGLEEVPHKPMATGRTQWRAAFMRSRRESSSM